MKTLLLIICLISFQAKGITVAVVDMGIDYWNFSEIKSQMWQNHRFSRGWDYGIQSDSTGTDYSYKYSGEYHGTAIAFSILKHPFKNKIFSKIKIMDIVYSDYEYNLFSLNKYQFPESNLEVYRKKKAFTAFSNHLGETFLSAARSGAEVINFSSGDAGFNSEDFKRSLAELHKKGVMVVVSAGNESLNLKDWPQYPCSYDLPNLLCVGSLYSQGKVSSFSNYGPSVQIYTQGEHGGYLKGTSFAAPLISQAIALIKIKNPTWGNHKVKKELFRFVKVKKGIPIFNRRVFAKFYF